MKKIYQHPRLTIVTMKTTTHLLEQSNIAVGDEYSGTTILSRDRNGFFDDEDDENLSVVILKKRAKNFSHVYENNFNKLTIDLII